MRRRLRVAACALLLALPVSGARAATAADACEAAGRAAERANHIPRGLLLAIGRVESGRYSAGLGRVTPWPWAVDAAGEGALYPSRRDAAVAARAALAAGVRNLDLGCFQVDLGAHPDAFASVRQALTPADNAAWAAAFLARLHARLGGWRVAVAAYHSQTPALGTPYLNAVLASWTDPSATRAVTSRRDGGGDPTWVVVTPVAGIRVITPQSLPGAAAGPVVHDGWPAGLAR
ncbi:MAG: hypothetical protein ACP5NP_07730 [Acetobacteraceae bacterium]